MLWPLLIEKSSCLFVARFVFLKGVEWSFYSREASFLIESEARSAESRSDVAPKARAAQADANLDQGLYMKPFAILTRYLKFQ